MEEKWWNTSKEWLETEAPLSNRWPRVELDGRLHKNTKLMLEFPKALFLVLIYNGPNTLFLKYINDLPDDVICNIAIYADDTVLYSKCDQVSDLWQ